MCYNARLAQGSDAIQRSVFFPSQFHETLINEILQLDHLCHREGIILRGQDYIILISPSPSNLLLFQALRKGTFIIDN